MGFKSGPNLPESPDLMETKLSPLIRAESQRGVGWQKGQRRSLVQHRVHPQGSVPRAGGGCTVVCGLGMWALMCVALGPQRGPCSYILRAWGWRGGAVPLRVFLEAAEGWSQLCWGRGAGAGSAPEKLSSGVSQIKRGLIGAGRQLKSHGQPPLRPSWVTPHPATSRKGRDLPQDPLAHNVLQEPPLTNPQSLSESPKP